MHRPYDHDDQYIDEDSPIVRSNTPLLERARSIEPDQATHIQSDPEAGRPTAVPPDQFDPGLQVLFPTHQLQADYSAPDLDCSRSRSGPPDSRSEDAVRYSGAMSSQAAAGQADHVPAITFPAATSDPPRLRAAADPESHLTASNVSPADSAGPTAAPKREGSSQVREDSVELATRPRVDSAQDTPAATSPPSKRRPQTPQRSPLKLETFSSPPAVAGAAPATNESIQASPTLSKHALPVAEGTANTLPAVQSMSPVKGAAATSPQSLPSFRQFKEQINQLTELAEAASATQEARAAASSVSHHHTQSSGSITSQSPMLPYYSHPVVSQTSPRAMGFAAKSPASTVPDGPHYGSPSQQQHSYATAAAAYYANRRRSSNALDHVPSFPPPAPALHSTHSTSSSGDSRARTASSADGYSTSHSTPVEPPFAMDGTPRPVLPPLPGMSGPFKCDYPDCTHAFATQYLLSSHQNVHSQNRPHYCSVKGCPRSEGGKGFKRKNEMIRHGLVHSSPGYICPFCPDRNHKYPRPDNLQRHVRVHHVDKDKNDPALREVLSQRVEGTGKARRRRTQGSVGGSA